MDILCIIPPYIPSYFNAGHHLGVFQVAAYLRKNSKAAKVVAIDAAALNITWKEICDVLTGEIMDICSCDFVYWYWEKDGLHCILTNSPDGRGDCISLFFERNFASMRGWLTSNIDDMYDEELEIVELPFNLDTDLFKPNNICEIMERFLRDNEKRILTAALENPHMDEARRRCIMDLLNIMTNSKFPKNRD